MSVQIGKLSGYPTRIPRSYKEATQGRHLRREDFEVDNDLTWGVVLACAVAVLAVSYLVVVL
jgi:hypothetical protein